MYHLSNQEVKTREIAGRTTLWWFTPASVPYCLIKILFSHSRYISVFYLKATVNTAEC